MVSLVSADSIAGVWEKSLRLFEDDRDLVRFDSQRGPCIEAADVVLDAGVVSTGQDISDLYPAAFHPLVESYAAGFLDSPPGNNATVSDRLYRWPRAGAGDQPTSLNQVDRAIALLRETPNTRYGIIGFWDPSRDSYLANPVAPLVGHLRLRSNGLCGTLVARTMDAWLGGFPMFVGFAELLRKVARAVDAHPGRACFVLGSYHVYEMDLPVVRAAIAAIDG